MTRRAADNTSSQNLLKSKRAADRTETLDLSIIIVNYNVKDFLEQCLISVKKALTGMTSELIVVDNASSDGSTELLSEKFPDVKLIRNNRNLGFAKSCNQGLEMAQGNYLVLLNPDTIVQEDTFLKMLEFFKKHPDTGMLGCKILNPDGTLQLACRRSFPTPWIAFAKLSGLSYLFPKSKVFGKYNLTYLDPDQSYEVEAISGSFMMIQKQVLEQVGGLDESFFLYGEDLDWCYRIREQGWKVRYFPETQIIHFKGESSKRAQLDNLRIFYDAMGRFAKKHFRKKYFLMPYWLLWVAIWTRAALSFLLKIMVYLAAPVVDLLCLSLGLTASVYVRFGNLGNLHSFVPVIIAYSISWLLLLKFLGCHDQNKFSSSKAALAVFIGFFLNAGLTFFFKQYAFSRAVVLFGGMFSLITVPGWRLFAKFLPKTGLMPFKGTLGRTLLGRNTVIVGDWSSGEALIRKFNSQIDSGYSVSGLVSTNGQHTGEICSGVPVLGAIDELNAIIADKNIHEVIFSTHQLSYDQILEIISRSGKPGVNFKLIPSDLDVIIGKASIDRIDDVPLLEIDYKLHQTRVQLLKRAFDLSLALFLLTLSLPIFLFKRYSSSPELKRKVAFSSQNQAISLYEFSAAKPSMMDKIPYLWNILKGDLSFVGGELYEVSPVQSARQKYPELKPGLTGLVQVNRHKNLSQEDKVRYDLYYMKNYSLVLDLEILFKTLFKI